MTNKRCIGIDCAWCANHECPNERGTMTNKNSIMINGVDVSGCEYMSRICMSTQKPTAICMLYEYCSNNALCYYKQLARKTEECEELKEKYKWYDHYRDSALYNKDLCDKKSDEIYKYKQALKKIKGIAHLIHFSTLPLHRGFTHDKADEIDAYLNKILQKCEVINEQNIRHQKG